VVGLPRRHPRRGSRSRDYLAPLEGSAAPPVNPTGPDAGGVTATEDDDRRQASRMYGIKQMTLVYRGLARRGIALCRASILVVPEG
jgi:hypothetical protein